MLPHFPITHDTFGMRLGARPLEPVRFIEVDEEQYQQEMTLKARLLAEDYTEYYQALPGSEEPQWEVLEQFLPNMAQHYPQHFTLEIEGTRWHWRNLLLGTEHTFIFGAEESLGLPPLDWLGRQVQEDLLLMSDDIAAGIPLVAGHLCFPNDWSLAQKIGRPFMEIHVPVPLFAEQIGRSSTLLMERLKVDRPITRANWSIKVTNQLTLTPPYAALQRRLAQELTLANIGERTWFRVEYQTLSRLARTQHVLFTVRTYQTPLQEVVRVEERARHLLGILQTMPASMLDYKGITLYRDTLLAYLTQSIL